MYEEAVRALQAEYAALPAGAPVRLAKKTSNLFRSRTASAGPGLDVSAFPGCCPSTSTDARPMCSP